MLHRPFLPLLWLGVLSFGCSATPETGLTGSGPRTGGSSCTANAQCSSGLCLAGVCQSGQPGGTGCSSATACASGVCQKGLCVGNGQGAPKGGACANGGQCASGKCEKGACTSGSGLPDGKSCGAASECSSGVCTGGICGTGTSGGTGAGGAGTSGGGTSGNGTAGGDGAGACSASVGPASPSGGAASVAAPPSSCEADAQDQTGCTCTPGASRACYNGAAATRGTGACKDGTQVCISEGELTGTYAACSGAVTVCEEPPPPALCKDNAVNNEPEILAAYLPASGQTVARNGQIKVWVNDEAPPFIAQGEVVDPTTGAILTPGDRTGKAADGYLFEPALYIAPATAEGGGTPHFPQWVKGHYNNNPNAGKPTTGKGAPIPGTVGAPMDPVPAGTQLPEKYTDEYIWDVCALGLAPGTYTAEFVIHDGDRDRGVGCVTIVIGQ